MKLLFFLILLTSYCFANETELLIDLKNKRSGYIYINKPINLIFKHESNASFNSPYELRSNGCSISLKDPTLYLFRESGSLLELSKGEVFRITDVHFETRLRDLRIFIEHVDSTEFQNVIIIAKSTKVQALNLRKLVIFCNQKSGVDTHTTIESLEELLYDYIRMGSGKL